MTIEPKPNRPIGGQHSDAETIRAALEQHIGSDTRYRHIFGTVFTPGAKDLAERCGAYWLLDKIGACQGMPKLRTQRFQVWRLDVRPPVPSAGLAHWATLTVEDGNDRKLHSERIDYTDFPLPSIAVWVVDGTIMLPSEY